MHYYKRNIGDYHKKAGRLSILQHGVYNLLIDACYDREDFPTEEEAIDWVWASTEEEIEATKFVLRKFFTKGEDGKYRQKRIEEEVKEFHEFCDKQAENGKKGGRPKGSKNKPKSNPSQSDGKDKKPSGLNNKPDGMPVETQKKPKPLTTNHKPLTKEKIKNKKFVKPTPEEIQIYCNQRCNGLSGQQIFDHYEANGWMRGKTKIKDWQACVRTWEANNKPKVPKLIQIANDCARGGS